jgi:hypothetical protein
MIAEVPEAVIGLGTVTRRDHIAAALDIGARFLVSPGFSAEIADLARQSKLPFLPGIATASELMAALDFGFSILKFFPAEPAGGIDMLRALHGPFPDALFCPTGGIDAARRPLIWSSRTSSPSADPGWRRAPPSSPRTGRRSRLSPAPPATSEALVRSADAHRVGGGCGQEPHCIIRPYSASTP